ncbi:MAG TPA: Ig-like domain-containing protein, partial [Polyangiaceae bacterium]|nr:Ig-like domain-containing protein [Polyangiaceae bacterium]
MTDKALRRCRPSSKTRLALLPLGLFALAIACTQGLRPPEVAPHGTLGMSELDPDDIDHGPLRVLYSSPKGTLDGPSEITVLFSKPMRPLELAADETPFAAKIEPAIDGTWQWVGTRAASFIPSRPEGGGAFRLPHASAFTVTIPKGTRSLDGDALAEDYAFSFETERPALVGSEPGDGASHLEPTSTITLTFNVPVTDEGVRKSVKLLVGGAWFPFKIERDESKAPEIVRIVPTAPLPLDRSVDVEIAEDLGTPEGPLVAGEAKTIGMKTYGPLTVTELRCSDGAPGRRCASDSPLELTLSNSVKMKDVRRALTVDPPVKLVLSDWLGDDDETASVSVSGRFQPGRSYTFRIAGTVTDEYGQSLKRPFDQRVDFGDLWPIARIGLTSGVLETTAKREFTVGHVNTTDLEIGAVSLGEDDILAMEKERLSTDALFLRPGAFTKKVPGGRKNVLEHAHIPVDGVLGGKSTRGAFAVFSRYTVQEAESPRDRPRVSTDQSIAQITDLALSAKVSRAGTVVWVTHLSDASPVSGADVRIRRLGQPAAHAVTDADGFARFTPAEFTPTFNDEDAVIFVQKDDDKAFRAVSNNVSDNFFDPNEDGPIGLMFTDRGIYRPGDSVSLKGIYRLPADKGMTTPSAGRPITVRVQGPGGEDVATLKTQTSPFGTFSLDVKVPASIGLGQSWVTASDDNGEIASAGFEVSEYRAAEFKVSAESDKPTYTRGDAAKWTAHGEFFFGAPMKGAETNVFVSRSKTSFSPPGLDGFAFDDEPFLADLPDASPHSDEVESAHVALDANGLATASAKLDLPGQVGPEEVTCNIDVMDVTRQTISSSTTALVHPAAHYVGISLDDWFVDAKT